MNKIALITGASSGIGQKTAFAFAKEGYQLILTCRTSISQLEAVAEELRKLYGIEVFTCSCDGGNIQEVEKLFSQISQLDVLVNNAGISHVGLLQDMSEEQWNQVISTNLSSVFHFSKYAIPIMLKQGTGKIINISSVWGNVGASMEVAYSASKGGVNAFTKALAKELAPSHIAVNAVACGYIDTPMNGHLSKEEQEAVFEEIPSGRPGTPEEIGEFLVTLASSSEYLTGQVITMDGAWT